MSNLARYFIPVLVMTMTAASIHAEPRALSDTRWRDEGYGVSLRPPVDTRHIEQTADQYMLRIFDDDGQFHIAVTVKRSSSDLTIDQVVEAAIEQIRSAQVRARTISSRELVVAEHPAALLYFRLPDPTAEARIIGQAIVQMNPTTYFFLELRCPVAGSDDIRAMFENVLLSVEFTDQQRLLAQRRIAVSNGQEWREELSIEQLKAALQPQQYFRLVENDTDIGYIRIRQRIASRDVETADQPGIEVETQSHVEMGPVTVNSKSVSFLSFDDTFELWTVNTTIRDPSVGGTEPTSRTFTETGMRNNNLIDITISGTRGEEKLTYEKPTVGYLSMVEAQMLGQLLPPDRLGTYGFYWYYSDLGKMTFRTDDLRPTLDGFVLNSQLSPNTEPQKAYYDAKGQLKRRELAEQRQLIAATPQEILQRWRPR
jgi:hypothetical protein